MNSATLLTLGSLDESTCPTLPRPGRSQLDDQLWRANRTAADHSRTVLGQILAPLDAIDRLDEQIVPLRTNPAIISELVTPDGVEQMLRWIDSSGFLLRAYHDGQQVPISHLQVGLADTIEPGIISTNAFYAALNEGYTFNLIATDRRLVLASEFCLHLERLSAGRVEMSAFVSAGTIASTPLHVDVPEILVMPSLGKKYWEIHSPETPFPFQVAGVVPPTRGVAFAAEMRPGEGVAVPRSWVHTAAPRGEFSICLSACLYRNVGAVTSVAAINGCERVPALRRPVTVTAATTEAELAEIVAPGLDAVDELLEPSRIADRIARDLAMIPPRTMSHPLREIVGAAGDPNSDHRNRRLVARLGGGLMAVRRPDGSVSDSMIGTGRRVVRFDPTIAQSVVSLLDGTTRTMDEAMAIPGAAELVPRLIVAELLEIHEPDRTGLDALLARQPQPGSAT